ncbi:uncharacterized protein LOC136096675 [Hydra vulgaris]|uniref:uncharacterized protein LOC136096675 n=1 Tax=Hydra vulgaris TaxID=6087 RepID=UPI0032EA1B17
MQNIEKDMNDLKESLNFQEEEKKEELTQIRKKYDLEIKNMNKINTDLENRSRRINIRVDGLKDSPGVSWSEFHLKNLKRSGIYINEDFAKETMEERKKLWEEVKNLRNQGKHATIKFNKVFCSEFRNLPAQIIIDNIEYSDKNMIAEKINEFFVNIGPNLTSKIKSPNNSFKSYLSDIQSELKYKELNYQELNVAVNYFVLNKTPGIDDIWSWVVANVFTTINKPIFEIFKSSIKTEVVPDKLKVAKVVPIFKTGESYLINNNRPISVLPTVSKLLERIFFNRLYEYLI